MYRLITASAHATGLPDKSVHLGVTSPPYYGLRAYDGDQNVEWAPVSYKVLAGLPYNAADLISGLTFANLT